MRTGEIVIGVLLALAIAAVVIEGERIVTAKAKPPVEPADTSASAEAEALAEAASSMRETQAALRAFLETVTETPEVLVGERDEVDAAIVLTRNGNPQVRRQAANILGHLGGEKAEAHLIAMTDEEEDASVLNQVFHALRQMGSEKGLPILMEALEGGTLREKEAAAGALNGMIGPGQVEEVLKVLATLNGGDNRTRNIRSNLYNALQQTGDGRVCEALLPYLLTETGHYRRNVANTIARCASPREIPVLVKAIGIVLGGYDRRYDSSSIQYILNRMREFADKRATPAVLKVLALGEQNVRLWALQALERLADPLAAEALCALEPEGNERRLYEEALKATPGAVFDKEANAWRVADAETMKKLLAEREEQIRKMEKNFENLEKMRERLEVF